MSVKNKAKDRDENGRINRKYTGPYSCVMYRKTPRWWVNCHMTRPRRREEKHLCQQFLRGADFEQMAFPLGNRKPHEFYW